MKRLVFVVLVAWSGALLGSAQQVGTLVSIPAVAHGGIFDPSLAATPPGQRAWMSYSAVNPSPRWPGRNTRTISTRLAYSDDAGATWTDGGSRINDVNDVAIGSQAGTWVNEVSSIVFDPFAPTEGRWKLFWHHYLQVEGKGQLQNGWIGFKSAATPLKLRGAREIKLFGARGYNRANDNLGAVTGAPLGGAPVIKVHELSKDLSSCLALSEPGAMATRSGIYLSLTCYQPKVASPIGLLGLGLFGISDSVILLKCTSPCRPTSPGAWRFVATLLTVDDAKAAGFIAYSAPALFAQHGSSYLIASPITNQPGENSYNGCQVFRFANLESGQLERDHAMPRVIQEVQGGPGTFNGACTYQPSVTASGFMYSQLKISGSTPFFQIFQTGMGLGR